MNRSYKSGAERAQMALLPPCPDDYVSHDNPVRAIEVYVDGLDLEALGFRHTQAWGGAGQPPYAPGDLLKLYLYGYLNQVRSSRRLAREAGRNLEVIWLLKGLTPGYRTIADFRKDNARALRAAHRDFVLLARELDLLGGELVAVDGSFFRGDASKASITTKKALKKQLAAIEADIEAYEQALGANDAAEDVAEAGRRDGPRGGDGSGAGPAEKLKVLMEKRAIRQAELEMIEASGESQLSRTDRDARLLRKNGESVAGYNVQTAVDARHKLIVADAVTNEGNDTGQLAAMAGAAKEALGVDRLTVVADPGYYEGDALKACEEAGITAYVPEPDRSGRAVAEGRFGVRDFAYDPDKDTYTCPGGQTLKRMGRPRPNGAGKDIQRYASHVAACRACRLRAQCLSATARRRELYRWVHEDVIERHRARMATPKAKAMQSRRRELAEHPFGTLKCRAGWRHFLVRGLEKVSGEWSLMALAYNFTRVLNILGLDGFRAALTERRDVSMRCAVRVAIRATEALLTALTRSAAGIGACRATCAV